MPGMGDRAETRSRFDAAWGTACVLATALLATSSLFVTTGLPRTSDGAMYLYRALALVNAWRGGAIYPRWAPDLAFGLGYPIFNYVPPLLGYLTAAFGLAGLTLQMALKLTVVLAVVMGSAGAYLLARGFLPAPAATLAAIAYTLAPYRLFGLYVQGDYPQLLAAAAMPYCLWGVLRLSQRVERAGYLALGLGLALLFLSDGASALLFVPLLAAYALWRLPRAAERRAWPVVLGAMAVGVAAVAFYWLPALLERDFVQTWRLSRYLLDAGGRLLSAPELVGLPERLDPRAANPYFPMSLGGHLVLLAVPSLALLGRRDPARGHVAFLWSALLGYVLMALPASEPAWTAISRLGYVGPARWLLGPASLIVALLVGAGATAWSARAWGRCGWFAAAVAVVLLGAAPYLFPLRPYADWSAALADRVSAYEQATGHLGATYAGEYLPRWVEQVPAAELRGQLLEQVTVLEERPNRTRYLVRSEKPGAITLPLHYFPGWRAEVDGRAVEAVPAAGSGLVSVQVDVGEHELLLELEDTPLQSLAWHFSLAGLLLLIAGLGPAAARAGPLEARHGPGPRFAMPAVAIALGVLLVAKVGYLEPRTEAFRRPSPTGAGIGTAHPLYITFDDRVALLGYDLQRSLLPQGESLVLRLYWQALRPLDHDLTAFVHLDAFGDGGTLVSAARPKPGGLPTSEWDPALYVEDRYEIQLPSDLPAVRYALRVGLLDAGSGAPLATDGGAGAYTLQGVQVLYHLPLDVKRFPGDRWYRFGDSIRLLGYELERAQVASGEATELTLYWRADVPVHSAMKRFLHLVGPDGQIVAQWDEWPVEGLYPTDDWLPMRTIADRLRVHVPRSAVPGEYSLVVGLYDAATLEPPEVSQNGAGAVLARAAILPVRLLVR